MKTAYAEVIENVATLMVAGFVALTALGSLYSFY
jgi:hypothetical protein